MVNIEKENSHKLSSLAQDIRRLYDDVAEFQECCARLCDSEICSPQDIGREQPSGIKTLSRWMTERMDSLKTDLRRIQQKVDTQQASPGI